MTARQVLEACLTELSKVNAPSLPLVDFNYYINKAINNYINKRYNIYDVNQQTTDDIRVLKSTAVLDVINSYDKETYTENNDASSLLSAKYNFLSDLQHATYETNLPSDYLHLLNCICIYKVNKNYKCYNGGSLAYFPAKRLTSDSWSTIITDYYNRPLPERPYYFIHNVNSSNIIPTNPVEYDNEGTYIAGTDMNNIYSTTTNGQEIKTDGTANGEGNFSESANIGSNLPRTITLGSNKISTVEKATAHRYGNPSNVRMEIRYGRDNSVFELVQVAIDYIKTPQFIRITPEQMDLTEDTSQIMEFPDYVCQEIINELTTLVMARTGDPLLNSFIPVNQTIANPAQAQAPAQPQQAQAE